MERLEPKVSPRMSPDWKEGYSCSNYILLNLRAPPLFGIELVVMTSSLRICTNLILNDCNHDIIDKIFQDTASFWRCVSQRNLEMLRGTTQANWIHQCNET